MEESLLEVKHWVMADIGYSECMHFVSGPKEWDGESRESDVAVQSVRPKLKEPRRFAVILMNDDYTTMEFVLEVLESFFHKSETEAHAIMLKVHQEGRGVAGVYPFDIAETKADQVHDAARERGFPLRCLVEPMESGSE